MKSGAKHSEKKKMVQPLLPAVMMLVSAVPFSSVTAGATDGNGVALTV